jgi:hypothetical protein
MQPHGERRTPQQLSIFVCSSETKAQRAVELQFEWENTANDQDLEKLLSSPDCTYQQFRLSLGNV